MTITQRCADPGFQRFMSRAYPRWFSDGLSRGLTAADTAEFIVLEVCGSETSETHHEWVSLVAAYERDAGALVADQHRNH